MIISLSTIRLTAIQSPNLGPRVLAIVAPVAQELTEGETVGDITNISTLRSTANYTADGAVQTPEIRVNGTAQSNEFTLSEGESVVIYVADDAGSTPYQRTIDSSVGPVPTIVFEADVYEAGVFE